MANIRILWTDDEIDLLKPHIIFLEHKGYEVHTTTNGQDAVEKVKDEYFDIIFLDENMPGLSGLEALMQIKSLKPNIPVVMITKSEEEDIMDEAIGSKMADYLIKPVNPKQILLSIKKNVEQKRLISQQTTSAYQSEFGRIGMQINDSFTHEEWKEVYRKLIYWELELTASDNSALDEILKMQKSEANQAFGRFIQRNYNDWFGKKSNEKPLFSPDIFRKKVFPLLDQGKKVVVILIDNLRFDQWRIISPFFDEYFVTCEEDLFFSILPTATMYARNAIFAGLMPSEIERLFPSYWINDDEEGNKNQFEQELFETQLQRLGRKEKFYFEKNTGTKSGKKTSESLAMINSAQLSILVYNFIDMISHARTEMEMIRELASDESAYRSITLSWFKHSPLFELLKELSSQKLSIVLLTDHGTIKVSNPVKIIGDRNTNTNLRYKVGKNLNYNSKQIFEVSHPKQIYLPSPNVSSSYVFALNEDFFAYPNNYNYYANYYRNTFQHGGISMEEMMVPVVTLRSKE